MRKKEENQQVIANRIVSETLIKGNVLSTSDFRIDGKLTGDINVKGRFVLGKEGVIEGNVSCINADISGRILGNINCIEVTTLRAGAYMKGELSTNKIVIERDVHFDAVCKMTSNGEQKKA